MHHAQTRRAGDRDMQRSVVLADTDAMARAWIHAALEPTEFTVVLEKSSVDGLTAAPATRMRDCLLLVENRLVGGTGLDVVRELRRLGCSAPALLMCAVAVRGFNESARAAGAQGTLLKTDDAGELLVPLRVLAEGGHSFDRRHPPLSSGQAPLSPREREILRLVATGATNDEVAARLGVSRESVKTLLSRAFRKLGVNSRAEAISAAHRMGAL